MILRCLGASSARDSTVRRPCRWRRSAARRPEAAAEAPWLPPTAPAATRRAPPASSGSPASPSDARANLGVRLAGQECEDVRRDFAFLRLAHAGPVGPEPGEAEQRPALVEANQTGTFLPSMVSYSENDVNGTRQRCSGTSQRFQWALLTLRMLVVPPSGSSRSSSLKSTGLPLACSFSRALLGGVHQRLLRRRHAPARHRQFAPAAAVAHDRRRIVGIDARHRRQVAGAIARRIDTEQAPDRFDVRRHASRDCTCELPTATFRACGRRRRCADLGSRHAPRRPPPQAATSSSRTGRAAGPE